MKLAVLSLGVLLAFSAVAGQIVPPQQMTFKASDNGSDTKAFVPEIKGDELIINFADQTKADNYLHIDCGPIDLSGYLPGGYIDLDLEIDNPILRVAGVITDPNRFWPDRIIFTGEAKIVAGRKHYRLYLDWVPEARAKGGKDHLYLFLHDMGGDSRGTAKLTSHESKLVKTAPDWRNEKIACYKEMFEWRNIPELGKYYLGKYDLILPAAAVENNPFVSKISLNGDYQKAFIGDITWKYDQLADKSFAAPGKSLTGAKTVTVPEPAVEDQTGGHYLYKKDFQFAPSGREKVYLKIGDLADSAEIYINGQFAGTQSSVRKRHEWVLKNGSRQANTWGKPAKEVAMFQHFERCGIPFPFDPAAMSDEDVFMLPIYTGEYPWDYVFDITGLLKKGDNTIAIRLYGNPVKGYWIYKHTDDRTYKNIFGILGDVSLLVEPAPAFAKVNDVVSGTVNPAGVADRVFSGVAASGIAKVVVAGNRTTASAVPGNDGKFAVAVPVPADFNKYTFQLYAFDKDGKVVDSRGVELNGTVIELRNDQLFVNGDRFLIRGINSDPGIEWDNDRTQSRRQWLKMLTLYKNLGFNSLRIEGVRPQQLKDALAMGIMVMPVYAAGSCNTSEVAVGNLVKPEHDFNVDAHREMAIMLSQYPNILIWNTGNEIHHTGGYDDKIIIDDYLAKAQQVAKEFDPAKRPVAYANLNSFGTYWCFEGGQDVFGYNSYEMNDKFQYSMPAMYAKVKKPIVFTEWGFFDNEPKALEYRRKFVDQWEKDMREKLAIMRNNPGCIGGYLYAYHGEMNDVRGREFLQEIMASYKLTVENDTIKFENQDVCPLRNVSVLLVSSDNVISTLWADELKVGRSVRLDYPAAARQNNAELRVEISYETHRGLKHQYTRMANRIKDK